MNIQPNLPAAYDLIHRGALAFADMEEHGMRVDLDGLKRTNTQLAQMIRSTEDELSETEEGRAWIKKFGILDLNKDAQLREILFKKFKYEVTNETETGLPSVDDDALSRIDSPAVRLMAKARKYRKAQSTFIQGILREATPDGYVHASFNLHLILTYRSSCDGPNLQNIPVRDPEIAKLVRGNFIPSPGNRLAELDFSGQEVRTSVCYHNDPNMLNYILDPTTDMHRDTAADMFKCSQDEVSKKMRYHGKNGFVFPQFYGSYWELLVDSLWREVSNGLQMTSGSLVKTHLAKNGVKSKEAFARHIREVEDIFWKERFGVYDSWKTQWWDEYCKRGYFNTLTGFQCEGVFRRNQVINSPIQGSAFHCLLWCLIELNDWLFENKMKTAIVSQVHDSVLIDAHPAEFDDVLAKAVELMRYSIRETWDWLIVPLDVEAEASSVDESWYDKKEIKLDSIA